MISVQQEEKKLNIKLCFCFLGIKIYLRFCSKLLEPFYITIRLQLTPEPKLKLNYYLFLTIVINTRIKTKTFEN